MANESLGHDPLRIRPVRPDDTPKLTEILRESPEAVNWVAASTSSTSATGGGLILVGESGSELAGFVMARQIIDDAEILNIAVCRSSRRRGVASALLASALQAFRDRNAARVFLEVRESNAPAIALYLKHGFCQVGKRPGYYGFPDEAALLLEKKLTG